MLELEIHALSRYRTEAEEAATEERKFLFHIVSRNQVLGEFRTIIEALSFTEGVVGIDGQVILKWLPHESLGLLGKVPDRKDISAAWRYGIDFYQGAEYLPHKPITEKVCRHCGDLPLVSHPGRFHY